jgi:hypothetical protein
MNYCSKHRLPENHNCPFDLIKKDKDLTILDNLIYQDALEFINKEITVAKIYEYVTTSQMTKTEAVELLAYFLENNDDPKVRLVSILAFQELNLRGNKVFKVIESSILSDEDLEVKKTAIKILKRIFPKRSKSLLDWIDKKDRH